MKIALNGQKLSVKEPAGPEIYTKNLYAALSRADQKNNYTVYTNADDDRLKASLSAPNFRLKKIKNAILWTQIGLAKELISAKPDIFFSPVHTLPLLRLKKTKVVGMIHGLEYRFNSGGSLLYKLLKGRHEKYVAKNSDALIVPSEFTKSEILKQNWKVKEDKITVVPEGVGEEFYKYPENITELAKEKYGLSKTEYLIFISTIQPRKNLPKLIEAFSQFIKETKRVDIKLLVVGKKGWSYEDSLESPKKFGIEDKVIFAGRVPQEDLPILLSGAKAFVSTSFEEGFGLPLLEAMASEVPAIVSDIPAFRQLGNNMVWLVDPNNAGDTKRKLEELFNGKYSQEMISLAKERAKNYTWDEAARKTLLVFEKTALL